MLLDIFFCRYDAIKLILTTGGPREQITSYRTEFRFDYSSSSIFSPTIQLGRFINKNTSHLRMFGDEILRWFCLIYLLDLSYCAITNNNKQLGSCQEPDFMKCSHWFVFDKIYGSRYLCS